MTPTQWAEDLIEEALRCPCDEGLDKCCARCECLIELASAIDIWVYEQVSGQSWADVEKVMAYEESLMQTRIPGWRGLGDTLLGWGLNVYYVLHAFRVFAVCAWRNWTGRIPRP